MNNFQSLINAAGITICLAVCALILGLLLATLFVVWESSRWRFFRYISTFIVMLLRGLPEILVILFIYFGFSQLFILLSDGFTLNFYLFQLLLKLNIDNIEVDPFLCAVIALALLYAAYASQTLRGALKAIPIGQWESAKALALKPTVIFFRLIMPQMWRYALPGLGNQWLVLLKDTALVSLIGINDLMLQTKSIITRTQEPFTWYLIVAIIYLVITLISQYIIKRIEFHTTNFERKLTDV
ncbi:arginine ABC transporter permease ArtQ [Candidatus Fukatsuia anoeciicola]|uniref:arginine ABC transporter permease ArtQ n=1 Tax=Candidatus Fukatsuia anoeciicola TaxID=2994492 RepID=UPI003463E736